MGSLRRCALLLVATAVAAVAGEPSPASVPGLRQQPPPALTHWPAIAHPGELRHAAFAIAYHDPALHRLQPAFAGPFLQAGDEVVVGWSDAPVPVRLPPGREGVGGILPLPGPGLHRAVLAGHEVLLRVVPADQPWPIAGLRNGFPVDASGVAVVLWDRRRDRAGDRAFRWLGTPPPRPTGTPLVLGPAALIAGVPVRTAACDHPTHPHHAALAALAVLGREPAPRTVLWLPGPEALDSGSWREEDRLLAAVRTRCEALGILPRLILALPPAPDRADPDHDARRRLLRAAARGQEWEVVELDGMPPREAAPGVLLREGGHRDQPRLQRLLAE